MASIPATASICNLVLGSSTLDFYINGIPAKDFVINNQGRTNSSRMRYAMLTSSSR
jgi:hypothetical protein